MIKIERLGVRILEINRNNDEEEYITINLNGSDDVEPALGRRSAKRKNAKKDTRIGKNKKEGKKKWSKKKILITIAIIVAVIITLIGISFG